MKDKEIFGKNTDIGLLILFTITILVIISTASAANIHSFFGTFYPNNQSMVLRYSYFFPEKTQEVEEYNESDYTIEFLNSSYDILKTYKPYTINYTANDTYSDWFGALIGVPNTTAYIRFKYKDVVLNNLTVTQNTPIVENISITNISENLYNITWNANDPDDDIPYENNESNNEKEVSTETRVETPLYANDYNVLWVPLKVGSWAGIDDIPDKFFNVRERNGNFFNSIYPLADTPHPVGKPHAPEWYNYYKNKMEACKGSDIPHCTYKSIYAEYWLRPYTEPAERIVGVAPDLDKLVGVGFAGASCAPHHCPRVEACCNVVLLAAKAEYQGLTHEIGHTYGFKDQYDLPDYYGELADRGWCLNSVGQSCEEKFSRIPFSSSPGTVKGARVNVKGINPKIDFRTNKKEYPLFYDFMGARTASWVTKEHYNKLLENLTK